MLVGGRVRSSERNWNLVRERVDLVGEIGI